MKRMTLVGLCIVVCSGCAVLGEFLRAAFVQPSFTFKTVSLSDISLGGLNLDTVWELANPNDVGISLASVDYALFVENKQVVAGTPTNGLQISPRGSSELHFPANIKFADIAAVAETFLNKDNASWRAEGKLGIQTPIGVIQLPIAQEGLFEVPKIPTVVFGKPKVVQMSLSAASVEFPLTITNKNTYALPVSGLKGTIGISGQNIGTLSTGNLGAFEGKGTKSISIPLQINILAAAGVVMSALRGGNAQLNLNAQIQSGAESLPLQINQQVNFSR